VASTSLRGVRATLLRNINDSRKVATDAYTWSAAASGARRPFISTARRGAMTELAFLKAFLAWESFLEQSFMLYMLGRKPPGAAAPARYAFPPSLAHASAWVVPEGRRYATWTNPTDISVRAERFFHGGRPFATTLRAHQNILEEARILRNAIAHASSSTQQKFENLVRRKLGTLPPNCTVGSFLGLTVPRTSPPQSFFDFYTDRLRTCATQVVPI
jgi:hypothetical protein